jgi:hypothetical protein
MSEGTYWRRYIAYFFIFMGFSTFFGGFMTNINTPPEFQYIGNNYMMVGAVFFVLGLAIYFIGKESDTTTQASYTQRTFQGKVCGNCHFFGKEDRIRQEKMFNAMPCEDFTP